ncbi:MAG: BMC domain-containing protein [Synergistota bacterium]|nr:BMC domain-containing protein [Synergistota bacterium]
MSALAIGLIETIGFVPAIEAADASLKAAQVELLACRFVTGGLVTVIIGGDVGAVNAAIEAGVKAALKVGKVISFHVIPRLDQQVLRIIDGRVGDTFRRPVDGKEKIHQESGKTEKIACKTLDIKEELTQLTGIIVDLLRAAGKSDLIKEGVPIYDYGVNKLRAILRVIGGELIDRTGMYRLKKPDLLKLLVNVAKRRGGERKDEEY